MARNSKSEKNKSVNLMDMVPVRNVKWETNAHGHVTLLKPKFKLPWLKKHFLPRMKRPNYRIKLDDKGSFIWSQCDGKTNVREMAKKHKEKFGEDVEPLLDRLALFLQSLEKNQFITYEKSEKGDP